MALAERLPDFPWDTLADARRAGLVPDVLLATWDLRPYEPDSDFVVAVLREA